LPERLRGVSQDASSIGKEDNLKTIKLTHAECDTIIAALRLWQRSPAYPEIDIAEEHGESLGDAEIDALIENKINA
jgi:hypothetical protein